MSSVRGELVTLRLVEDADFDVFCRWMNDPDIAWWMDYEHEFSVDDIAEDIAVARREGMVFTITVDEIPVGRIGLNRFRQDEKIASTYMFVGEANLRRQGVGRDAMMALLRYAFGERGLVLVDLMVLSENNAAIGLYRSCGFIEDGRLRNRSWKQDHWMDHVWMSVTRDEFVALDIPAGSSGETAS